MNRPGREGSSRTGRLARVWRHIESGAPGEHTSVVVPSLSFDTEELSKILGVQYYEERFLFVLLRLRDPRARVVFISSQPIDPDIVDYYLDLLPPAARRDADRRLTLLAAHDATARPLTAKVLERPRLLERIRAAVGDTERAYLTCFNATPLELALADDLGIPLNGPDPALAWAGTKTGSRRVFEAAGVPVAFGVPGVRTRADVVEALDRIARRQPGVLRAVVKLDESFAGAGNAVVTFPSDLAEEGPARLAELDACLDGLAPAVGEATAFLVKLEEMGGVVETFLDGSEGAPLSSPSAQLRVDPMGEVAMLSTHEQVLGGPIGQTYVGCRFPADERHREAIHGAALAVGRVLAELGVVGRFAIDFLSDPALGPESLRAVEINLRMGGTTFPFMALESLVPGALDPSGIYRATDGTPRFYFATDNVRSREYVGLCPEDLLEIGTRRGLVFDRETGTGPVFHMIGALSEFGRFGVTCIGRSPEEAEECYRTVVQTMSAECPEDRAAWRPPTHPLGVPISGME